MTQYVHGYTPDETKRLREQSTLLSELFYDFTYEPGSRVLEAGCGVGAQTYHLTRKNPDVRFTSLDISLESLTHARGSMREERVAHDSFLQADMLDLPFEDETFDHIFVCFVLEHLADPLRVLRGLKRVLKPGGTLTAIEGDHGSCFFHPQSDDAWHVWNCLIEAQARMGGDSLIGRRLYPLLRAAELERIEVKPRFIYADAGRPEWVDYFTIRTIVAMVSGVKERALEMGLTDEDSWARGMKALERTAQSPDGVFCYTFFQGCGVK